MWKDKLLACTIVIATILLERTDNVASTEDSEILFKINWPGRMVPELLTSPETYMITSANNEKYQCSIPDTAKVENKYTEQFVDVDPITFLQPLFDQNTCSFRLETYWTYEICHGQYVRQYHEEREGKKVKIQEYNLGTFDKDKYIDGQVERRLKKEHLQSGPPVKKVDGIQMPYVEIEMTDGTMCDLNNMRRSIKVQYICYSRGKHDIYSLEEVSSCEYEAVVLSPLICDHPDYRARGIEENVINCVPVDNAPKKPRALLALGHESLKFRRKKVSDEKEEKFHTIIYVDKDSQDGEARVQVEIHPIDVLDKHNVDESGNSLLDQGGSQAALTPVQSFLSGKNCLNGGNGWWKYEFCYGRSVSQYHIERDGSRTTVDLGRFDKAKHIEWIEAHPLKRPKPFDERKQLSHFYSDGSVCDKTGKLRQTEVRLKCVKNPWTSPSSVSLFLLEPKTCEYILGVESPLICDILEFADEYGLMSEDSPLNFDDPKTSVESPSSKKDSELDERIAHDDL